MIQNSEAEVCSDTVEAWLMVEVARMNQMSWHLRTVQMIAARGSSTNEVGLLCVSQMSATVRKNTTDKRNVELRLVRVSGRTGPLLTWNYSPGDYGYSDKVGLFVDFDLLPRIERAVLKLRDDQILLEQNRTGMDRLRMWRRGCWLGSGIFTVVQGGAERTVPANFPGLLGSPLSHAKI